MGIYQPVSASTDVSTTVTSLDLTPTGDDVKGLEAIVVLKEASQEYDPALSLSFPVLVSGYYKGDVCITKLSAPPGYLKYIVDAGGATVTVLISTF